jgi:hypothetical protein
MQLQELRKRVDDARKTLMNTSPEIAVPYLLGALEETVRVFEQVEKELKARATS